MRKEENSIILEPNDKLYRYNLGINLPSEWSIGYSSPEYFSPKYGRKNAIGAFFFFDDRQVAKQTLAQAIYNQSEKGNNYTCGTITHCEINNEIRLLDLSTGLCKCSNIISVLCDLGIDVVSDKFYNYQKDLPHSCLQDVIGELFSEDKLTAMKAANEINQFFLNCPPLLGQSLTDFSNGLEFKNILNNIGFEGYAFWENLICDTYCLFNSEKIGNPIHEEVSVESDTELKELIALVKENAEKGKF